MRFLLAMKNASIQLSTDPNQQARRKKGNLNASAHCTERNGKGTEL